MINFTTAVMHTDDMLDFLKVLIKYYIMSSNNGEFFSGNSFLNKFETVFFADSSFLPSFRRLIHFLNAVCIIRYFCFVFFCSNGFGFCYFSSVKLCCVALSLNLLKCVSQFFVALRNFHMLNAVFFDQLSCHFVYK